MRFVFTLIARVRSIIIMEFVTKKKLYVQFIIHKFKQLRQNLIELSRQNYGTTLYKYLILQFVISRTITSLEMIDIRNRIMRFLSSTIKIRMLYNLQRVRFFLFNQTPYSFHINLAGNSVTTLKQRATADPYQRT